MKVVIPSCVFLLWIVTRCANGYAVNLYDATANFSTTVNSDTSIWSYRYEVGVTPNGDYPLLPTYGTANGNWTGGNPGAWNTGSSGLPEIGVNETGVTVSNQTTNPGDNFSLANGTFFMRPASSESAVLSFLYPTGEQYPLTISVSDVQIDTHGGDGVTIYFETRHSDGTVQGHGDVAGGPGGGNGGFDGIVSQPGDRFNIILSPAGPPNGNGSNAAFDTISLTATVVPEPSTLTLLALGALGLLARFRKKS